MAAEKQADMNWGKAYQLKLTREQRAAMREPTGLDGEAIELTGQELEERITPARHDAWV
jgi:hypothetical protein